MSNTVVMFGAAWCAPCKKTLPVLERACDALGLDLEYVDVEFGDSRANDVTTVPTVRVYDDFDEVVREHRGGMSRAQALAFLRGLST
ncbi:thioredoxin family protein [Streptomyces sp. NPDC014864]|uniref:thioredoxin family protein n=1 Tax=Streptomyces sp. NPDC014864 TaxID=3364924 RepID=UPI0037026898